MTVQEEKKWLRSRMKELGSGLSERYKEASDRAIAAHLLGMPEYRAAETVFCFVGARWEIDTLPILKDVLARGKRLCVPLCTAPGMMEARHVTTLEQLLPGRYSGILEPPADAPAVTVDEIDFAVLPCTTCSRTGQRLGKGGGYYDRFLAHYRGGSVLLCREKLLRDEIPVEPHDYPVPWVLTERGLYEDGIPARL